MTLVTPKATLPAPFNVFYYFARWVWLVKNECRSEHLNTTNNEKRRKYAELLDRLIKSKMHFEYEDSVQDDFNDLRLDVRNMIYSKHPEII